MEWSVRTPQAKELLSAATEVALAVEKVPVGGVDSPDALSPQQASVPSVLTAQAWAQPALTDVKVPVGTTQPAKPGKLPQQAMVPSILTPQEYWQPALICLKTVRHLPLSHPPEQV